MGKLDVLEDDCVFNPSALDKPPHIPKQWVDPKKPNRKAESKMVGSLNIILKALVSF